MDHVGCKDSVGVQVEVIVFAACGRTVRKGSAFPQAGAP